MHKQKFPLIALLLWMSLTTSAAADKVTYHRSVEPILREHCFACHNQDEATAGLVLDSFEGLVAGGASGEVVAAGDPNASRLWKLVTHQEEPPMPPGDKLPEAALQVLRAWIEGGLVQNSKSAPLKSRQPAIAQLNSAQLGKPVGEPAMPEQLFHEPLLWTAVAGPVDAVATSPWAPLAAIAWQRQVSFYDTSTQQLLGIIPYLDGVPQVVRFSRDGNLVLVAGGRHAVAGSAAVFEVKTGARLTTLGDEFDIVLAADMSPDLSLVALGGPQKTVRVYHVADGSLAYQINKHTDWITAISFSPDGRLLATADRNGAALLWQAAAGHERSDLRGHKQAITSLDWRADGAMLATASEDGTVRLWDPTGNPMKTVEAHKKGVLSVRFSREGIWVTCGRDRHVRIWKSDGGAIADLGELPGLALAATFNYDGSQVLASDYTGEVRLIDVASKKRVATLQANPPLLSQRMDAAQRTYATAKQDFQQAELGLLFAIKKQQLAEQNVQNTEVLLAPIANESARLRDLAQLAEQHQLAQAAVASTQQKLQQAQQEIIHIASQQARFAQAGEQFASEFQQQQSQYQKLTSESKQAAFAHQQVASKLASHRLQFAEASHQLQSIQSKLAELEARGTELQVREIERAAQQEKLEAAMADLRQQVGILEARKRDFLAAEALRKNYLNAAERPR